jgi:tyrosyl-tRNA synthetase
MGGGYEREVGDSLGRDAGPQLLSLEQIEANKESIKQTFRRFVTFGEGRTDAVMVDNAEWLTQLNYIEFLRDVGRHFSFNRMLSFDSVKLRLDRDQELVVPGIQLHDPAGLRLRRAEPPPRLRAADGRVGPVGEHRQRHRSRRRLGTEQLYALTCPLITTASGAKMGKTAAGAVCSTRRC